MLVLSRKPGEKILIGDSIVITVVRIGPNTVRIGIEAPRGVSIVRDELAPLGFTSIDVECKEDEDLDLDSIISGTY